MITLLSPAKDLNFEPIKGIRGTTEPAFIGKSAELGEVLKKKSAKQLSSLMGLSDNLGSLNHTRFQSWSDSAGKDGKTAIHAFNGEVYKSLDAASLSTPELRYAQSHLRILSGLYGVLKPKDLILPYRLEMGTKLSVKRKKNLYEFWGSDLTDLINQHIASTKSEFVVNLASNEYFKAVQKNDLTVPVITPVFKDLAANGTHKTKFFYAKKQRGKMARFICEHLLMDPQVLKKYDIDGYYFSTADSNKSEFVFLRDKVQ